MKPVQSCPKSSPDSAILARAHAQQSDSTIVRELILIFTDLFIAEAAATRQSVPPLPALSALLTRGRQEFSGDWRRWILREVTGHQVLPVPVASISRVGATRQNGRDGSDENWWLATPVHLDAGLTDVRMSARPVDLSSDEWGVVVTEFNRLFAADGFHLSTGTKGVAFLATPSPLEADTTDPMRVLGQSVEPALPSGPEGRTLRLLMTGVQMWLHDHPLNAARLQRNELAVNGLWIWGGGREPDWMHARPMPRLASSDPYLVGLWRLMKEPVDTEARHFDALRARDLDSVIVSLECVRSSQLAQRLEDVDRQWMAPAWRALRDGHLESLVLHLNDRVFRVGRFDTFRFWRRPRHWLEAAA